MLVSTGWASNKQLEVTRALSPFAPPDWRAAPSNPTQAPITHNLRLKQFGQISGNYCRGLVAVATRRPEWDILTGFYRKPVLGHTKPEVTRCLISMC